MVSPNGRNSREKSYLYFSLFVLLQKGDIDELFQYKEF